MNGVKLCTNGTSFKPGLLLVPSITRAYCTLWYVDGRLRQRHPYLTRHVIFGIASTNTTLEHWTILSPQILTKISNAIDGPLSSWQHVMAGPVLDDLGWCRGEFALGCNVTDTILNLRLRLLLLRQTRYLQP